MRQIQCSWVPGTLNRVRIQGPSGPFEITMERAERVLGRGKLHDLYLKGKMVLNVGEEDIRNLVA